MQHYYCRGKNTRVCKTCVLHTKTVLTSFVFLNLKLKTNTTSVIQTKVTVNEIVMNLARILRSLDSENKNGLAAHLVHLIEWAVKEKNTEKIFYYFSSSSSSLVFYLKAGFTALLPVTGRSLRVHIVFQSGVFNDFFD